MVIIPTVPELPTWRLHLGRLRVEDRLGTPEPMSSLVTLRSTTVSP